MLRLSQGDEAPARPFTVRLHFAELQGAQPGERVFDVKLQGEVILRDFDVARQGPGQQVGYVSMQQRGIENAWFQRLPARESQ